MKTTHIAKNIRFWLREHGGIITRRQLQVLGASDGLIQHWLTTGRLITLHRGVYVAGDVPITAWQRHAGVLAAARGPAMLSHGSAAWLWDLSERAPAQPHLLVPAARCPREPGYETHRTRQWPHASTRRDLACTDPLRTIIDMAATVDRHRLESLLDQALARQIVSSQDLLGVIGAPTGPPLVRGLPPLPGIGKLRCALRDRGVAYGPAPSVLESRMSRLLARTSLPLAEVEHRCGPQGEYRLDYAYPLPLLAIEVDGYRWHSSPAQLQRDHARRNALIRSGWMILVYTWYDVTAHPSDVADAIESTYRERMAQRRSAEAPHQATS